MSWITAHWAEITIACLVLISVLNAVTRHYGEHSPGLRRALAFVIDLLSILTSRGSVPRGVKGLQVKLPLVQTSAPRNRMTSAQMLRRMDGGYIDWELMRIVLATVSALLALFVVCFWFSGCGASLRQQIDRVSRGADIAGPSMSKICDKVATECEIPSCPSLKTCHDVQREVVRGALAAQLLTVRAYAALDAGEDKSAARLLGEAVKLYTAAQEALMAYGVDLP